MGWTPTHAWPAEYVVDATDANAQWRDNLDHLHGPQEQPFTNSSGVALAVGDVVVQDSDTTVTTTTTVGDARPVLVATAAVTSGAVGFFAASGFYLVNVTGAVARGDALQTSGTAKKAQAGSSNAFGESRTTSSTAVIAVLGAAGGLADHNHTATGDGGELTSPHILTSIADTNGATLLGISATASAVNYLNLSNAATGGVVSLQAAGSDTDVNVQLASQNAGVVKLLTGASLAQRFLADGLGNLVCGAAALATSATDGFLYVPSSAGAPSGTPTSYTGRVPMDIDTTNERVYFRIGSNWRYVRVGATGDPDAGGGGTGWLLDGNTVGAEKYIGTDDDFELPIRANNIERARFSGGAATNTAFEIFGSRNRAPLVVFGTNFDSAGQTLDFNLSNYESAGLHKTTMVRFRAITSATAYASELSLQVGAGGQDAAPTEAFRMDGVTGKAYFGNTLGSFPHYLAVHRSLSAGDVSLSVKNLETANGASRAHLNIEVGGTSAGDPFALWTIPSGTTWGIGTDNSDSDTFQIYEANDVPGNSPRLAVATGGRVGVGTTTQFGSGTGPLLAMQNCTAAPSTNPTTGGVLYVDAGALKYRGSSGTVTTLGNA